MNVCMYVCMHVFMYVCAMGTEVAVVSDSRLAGPGTLRA